MHMLAKRNAVGLVGVVMMIACGPESGDEGDYAASTYGATTGECDTTGECRLLYGPQATDCLGSKKPNSICMCGSEPCGGAAPSCNDGVKNQNETGVDCGGLCPPCAPSPDEDECDTTTECRGIYGPSATDCVNSRSDQSWCDCGGTACADVGTGGSGGSTNPPPPSGSWRVGYSADGNIHDWDDLHASPMALALLHRAGLKGRLVHFDYNNHLGEDNPPQAQQQRQNINWAINAFGYDPSIFYDDQTNLSGAVASIRDAINASSATNRFFLICAGPMEVCWRGINAAQDAKEQYVTVISHSAWNDNHSDTSELAHTWTSIKNDFDVLAHHINDQNPPAFNSDCSSWTWVKSVPGYGSGLYDRLCNVPDQKAGDASDAGMMYYLIKRDGDVAGTQGTISPTMSQVRSFFGQ